MRVKKSQKSCFYKEKISPDSKNVITLYGLIIFLAHKTKTKQKIIQKDQIYLNETMTKKQEWQKCMS